MKIAIIGAGVSGLSVARMLNSAHKIKIFEKSDRAGGLIKCSVENGNLYHRVGGHVFNSKDKNVLNWFWNLFDKENDFIPAQRNVAIALDDEGIIGAPIENHIYQLNESTQLSIIEDFLSLIKTPPPVADNFDDFLKYCFGETLYQLYFGPYNRKIWRRDLKEIPLFWLDGKLPTPSIKEILHSNFSRNGEGVNFVHSSFYYPKKGGSQFIVDTLSKGLNIVYNAKITEIRRSCEKWVIENEIFDKIIFAGNIKDLPDLLKDVDFELDKEEIASLEYHGTTSVLCHIEANPYSWVYMPSVQHESHRIICTGNFSPFNNAPGYNSVTIEFSEPMSKESILDNLTKIPFNPQYITHHYEEFTYPVQNQQTSQIIQKAKNNMESQGMYLLGRFGEWEYYNMDAAIGAALKLVKQFFS